MPINKTALFAARVNMEIAERAFQKAGDQVARAQERLNALLIEQVIAAEPELNRDYGQAEILAADEVFIGTHECPDSPIDVCAYDLAGYNIFDNCLFCHQPEERK